MFELSDMGMNVADEGVKAVWRSPENSGLSTLTVSMYTNCVLLVVELGQCDTGLSACLTYRLEFWHGGHVEEYLGQVRRSKS